MIFTLTMVTNLACLGYYGYSIYTHTEEMKDPSWQSVKEKLSGGSIATEVVAVISLTSVTLFGSLIIYKMWIEWFFYHSLVVFLNIIVTVICILLYPALSHYLNLTSSAVNAIITVVFIKLSKEVAQSMAYYQNPEA